MEKEILVNQKRLTKEGYVIISSYFLDYCVEILGTGPAMLYIQLLNYCHKGKDLAWPTLATLGRKMQFTPKSITKFHRILLKQRLIKKINKGRTASGNYRRNIYQVIPIHRIKNTLSIGKNFPYVEEKITPNLGKKLPTNNTNPNNINSTAANRENAAAVAKRLAEHPKVAKVYYPGLENFPGYQIAKEQMFNGFGGMLSFDLTGGFNSGVELMQNLKLITLAVSLGNVDSLIQHPASMTHAAMSPEDRLEFGITDSLIRFSVGIENIEDVIADFDQALTKI